KSELREPVLLIDRDARRFEIPHPAPPQRRVGRDIAGHFIALAIRAARIDPAIMRDKRHAEFPAEGRQAAGKQIWRGFIKIGAAAHPIPAAPFALASLAVEPAIELNIAEAEPGLAE